MTNHLKECIKSIEEIESAAKRYKEIKRMAWEIILSAGYNTDNDSDMPHVRRFISSRTAWNKAERFYDYAKEKEAVKDA